MGSFAVSGPAPTVTEDDVLAAIRVYLLAVAPAGFEVVQTQNNRVPEPTSENFIVMTPRDRVRLATNTDTWDRVAPSPATKEIEHSARFDLQLDIHGPAGSDLASVIAATFVDDYGRSLFDGTPVSPLYAGDGHQMPFINGEQQYENRWVVTLSAQIKPTVSTPMQFADTLTPVINPALGG